MRLGPFEVLGAIGRGGTGSVYRARGRDGRVVAVKLLHARGADDLVRFDREVRIQGALGEADGFVPLLETGVAPEGAWIAMPLLEGGTLRDRLGHGPRPIEETIGLGISLARALARAHARGLVHRDVKPENVIFTGDGTPLLADLGLAKHFRADATGASQSVSLSRSGALQGTAGYMPREQMADAKSAGPAADVFALGAILHECLSGTPTFQGESLVELLARVDQGEVEALSRLRPEAPAWLENAIRRALAREPARRFVDGAAFLVALERRGEVEAPPVGRWLAVAAVAGVAVLGTLGGALLVRRAPAPRALPSAPPPAALDARGLQRRAVERLEKGDGAGARKDLDLAIGLDSKLAPAFAYRGRAKEAEGDHAAAVSDCDRAIELDPGLALAWAFRGDSRFGEGDEKRARADLDRALEIDPRLALGWALRARVRLTGELAAAKEDAAKALALDPGLALAWAVVGDARSRESDAAGALAALNKAIDLDPRLAVA
jgi:serine/threonine-protein kinase